MIQKNQSKKPRNRLLGISLKNARPAIIKLLLISVAAAGLVGIISLLSGEFGELQSRVLATVVLTSGLSVGMLIYLSTAGTRYQFLGAAGIVSAFISFCLGLWLVWASWNFFDNGYMFKNYLFSTITAVGIAHACLIIRLLGHSVAAVRAGTATTVVCIGLLVVLFGWLLYNTEGNYDHDFLFRLMGVLGILVVLGTIITPVWARLQKQ